MNAYDIILEIFDEIGYKKVEMEEVQVKSKYAPQPYSTWKMPRGQKLFVDPEKLDEGIIIRDGNGSECTIHCYGTEVDVSDVNFAVLNITLDLTDPESIKNLKNRLA